MHGRSEQRGDVDTAGTRRSLRLEPAAMAAMEFDTSLKIPRTTRECYLVKHAANSTAVTPDCFASEAERGNACPST